MFDSMITAVLYLVGDGFNIFYLMIGVMVGIMFSIVPGLGGAAAIALLLPLTFGMEPEQAIILMGGVMGAVSAGGAVTSILLNTPGTAPNAATCFDGYPMAQQGKAGLAIGAAAGASTIGGVFGLAVLVAILPVAKAIVLWFGPPAFFMMAVLGLTALTAAGGDMLRGLIAGCAGLFLGFIGYDDIGGTERYTFGIDYLWDGMSLVPALIGLFAISEMLTLYVTNESAAKAKDGIDENITGIWDGVVESFKEWKLVMYSSGIGTVMGAIPGVGGTVGSFMAYTFAATTCKNNENFGKGDIRGVIAPEASNNAKDGGSLIPTLAFGMPGGAEMAIFLGVLILHGLNPGPMLLIEREWTIFTLIIAILIATVLSNVIVLMSTRYIIKVAKINITVLVPSIMVIAFVAAFTIRNSVGDTFVTAIFGVLGYLMRKFDYPRITVVIALVLAELMEKNYTQSMLMFGGDGMGFFHDKTTLVIFLTCIAALSLRFVQIIRARKRVSV